MFVIHAIWAHFSDPRDSALVCGQSQQPVIRQALFVESNYQKTTIWCAFIQYTHRLSTDVLLAFDRKRNYLEWTEKDTAQSCYRPGRIGRFSCTGMARENLGVSLR